MNSFCVVLFLFTVSRVNVKCENKENQINQLVKQWAPLIWLAPDENYYPSSVEKFLQNVYLTNGNDILLNKVNEHNLPKTNTRSLYLVSNNNLDNLLKKNNSFLNGENPKRNSVPIYAIVTPCNAQESSRNFNSNKFPNNIPISYEKCDSNLNFHVTYWIFYPYNKGKQMCFLGKVPMFSFFGRCFGHLKSIGNHVGDWERMSLTFKGNSYPSEMYVATHHLGGYYKFDPNRFIFKYNSKRTKSRVLPTPQFPLLIRTQAGHPILFAAEGSHGLWSAPGVHKYNTIPYLTDKCGYGDTWKTWADIKIFNFASNDVPDWINYKGRWGNPKSNCVLFNKLGLCEHTDGPPGLLRNSSDFSCDLCENHSNNEI